MTGRSLCRTGTPVTVSIPSATRMRLPPRRARLEPRYMSICSELPRLWIDPQSRRSLASSLTLAEFDDNDQLADDSEG
jgi:hypothetical protein